MYHCFLCCIMCSISTFDRVPFSQVMLPPITPGFTSLVKASVPNYVVEFKADWTAWLQTCPCIEGVHAKKAYTKYPVDFFTMSNKPDHIEGLTLCEFAEQFPVPHKHGFMCISGPDQAQKPTAADKYIAFLDPCQLAVHMLARASTRVR
jgi:hypothetical protein